MKQIIATIAHHIKQVKIWQWYAIGFILIVIAGMAYMALEYMAGSFIENTMSAIGNMPGAYWQFAIGGSILGILGAILLAKALKRLGIFEDKYLRILLHLSLVLLIGVAVIPYTHSLPKLRIIHTALGWIVALNLVLFMQRVQTIKTFKAAWKNKFLKHMPYVTSIGTLSLYVTIGLNLIMETFFFITMLAWILVIGTTKE